jgi:hypothetical protein
VALRARLATSLPLSLSGTRRECLDGALHLLDRVDAMSAESGGPHLDACATGPRIHGEATLRCWHMYLWTFVDKDHARSRLTVWN